MTEISAAAVKSLRDKTGLPIMKCKEALQTTGGDEQAAIEYLRKDNIKVQASRVDRETAFGRMGLFTDWEKGVGALVELLCESAPVAQSAEFIALANDMARQLALGPGAQSADELLAQKSPDGSGQTLGERMNDQTNRIREVFKVGRIVRVDGKVAGYAHHAAKTRGVLVEVTGGNAEAARDIAMHVAAKWPQALIKEDLDPALVEKEREILTEASRKEGKPENIIAKMVEGRLRNFFAEHVLLEQEFVKEASKTVGKLAQEHNMKVVRYINWELGK